ncbi:nitroreductase family protein [Shimia aestuarii]|uniref:nitroreductase family protein n=1 Tax=Shimia aestuarii TaxID=254406 RepID=UPI001FB521E2|nr:nitroreductase family protein [Shimia aestuarii]
MPTPNPAALEFLLTRRSRPAKTLTTPVPTRAELAPLLEAALRSPDHGKLEPWRLLVLEEAALHRLGDAVGARAAALGLDEVQTGKGRTQFDTGHLAVAVIESPVIAEKVPAIEQTYSAGAVCLALLNAALASGWGANWLSGWPSHDAVFLQESLGLAPHERLAGLIHIGTETAAPPERPRPSIEDKVTWVSR